MPLVLGLGNPGERYARTRHNVAWWVLDLLAERGAADELERDALYRARLATVAGKPLVLLQPLTFMNLSGDALAAWERRHGAVAGDWLAVSDDVYLPVGALRLRTQGSSGGHRGLESLEARLGTREFPRLRLGVGAAEGASALRSHVLETFSPEEMPAMQEGVRQAADAIECWLAEGWTSAMNRFNRKVRKEEQEP